MTATALAAAFLGELSPHKRDSALITIAISAQTRGNSPGSTVCLLNTWVHLDASTPPLRATAAALRIPGNTDAYVSGSLELAGAGFWIHDQVSGYGTWDASLRASGTARLTGTGTVEFSPNGHYHEKVLRADAGHCWDLGAGIEIVAPPGAIGGRLRIESAASVHDVLQVNGPATLEVALAGGFVPLPSQSFAALVAGSRAGSFANVPGGRVPAIGGGSLALGISGGR
jgi:hypothetical protein